MSKSSDFWAAHLSAIDAEGITKKVYALRHGLSLKRLYYWRGRLNRPRADEGTQHRAVTSSCPAPRQFVAVQVKETAPEALPCILILGVQGVESSADSSEISLGGDLGGEP